MTNEEQKKMYEERRRKRERNRKALTEYLSSPTGSDILADLLEEYDGDDQLADTDRETYFNLGARSVVRALKNLRDTRNQE